MANGRVPKLRQGGARSRSRPKAASFWVRVVAWLVLLLGVTGSLVGAAAWKGALNREASNSLTNSAATAAAVVSSNLTLDANLMAQLRGLIVTNPDLSNVGFVEWLNVAGVAEQFPGGVGFGFVERVPAADLAAFAAARRTDPVTGLPSPDPFTVIPDTHPAEYCLQKVGYWEATKIADFEIPAGLDFCAAELTPGGAASPLPSLLDAATDRGLPSVLTPDQLIPGVFAAFVPVYRGGVTPSTVEARRADSIGWVAGSFRSAALTDTALNGAAGLTIEVSHTGPGGEDVMVSAASADQGRSSDAVVSTVEVDPGWTIRVMGRSPVGGMSAERQALAVLGLGLTLSVLGFLFIRLLGGSRERALDLVEERTGELAYQALHDSLTGLPNRALILDRAGGVLARARRQDLPVAALFIDLDDFKAINDTLGHGAGDELLQSVATRFAAALRASDTVGRLGGDEFVILVEGASLLAGPEVVAERVLDVLSAPFVLNGEPRQIAASIGIASGPRPTAEDWLRDADIALYEAKAAGKNGYIVFESEMQQVVQSRVALEQDLRDALDNDQFFLLYQPTFDLRTHETTGVEALIRWSHPTQGIVMPDDFIPAAERTGLIVPIGRWVLGEACRQGAEWNRRGQPLTMSVNVSARQLERDDLVDDVRHALDESGLDPGSLVLEITETTLMRDASATQRHLEALKEVGVRLAIDDFGTGYSSMAYLRQFPVDVIKIDRSFISGIADSGEAAVLIRTLVQMGQALGIETLAEGIEDDVQLAGLMREQCDSGQGFLFARPLAPTALEDFLQMPPASAIPMTASPADAR
jgi:diguanylate cyclase (GGDEF)-like protein